ncbi:MAG: histidine--tRNA ligase [Clostridium butyricum]|nr:histidine--tRNA ligase [Clostridium butyricum]
MNKNLIKPSILSGFMELLPNEQEKFNDIVNKILDVYEKNGCLAMDTPIIEKAEVLLAKSGGETEKQVYSFQKGKNNLALRFDLTVPFARFVAQYYDKLNFPFKRYQFGKVYRGERNQRGRYREFYQCDVDVIGKEKLSINNDAWVISLVDKAFKEIGLSQYKFQISNRKILKGALEELNIDNALAVMTLIDKYDKIGKLKFTDELKELIGGRKSEVLNNILDINGTNNEIIEQLSKLDIKNNYFIEGISELKKVKEMLNILNVDDNSFIINLKIIRGLDYYTGTVFETLLTQNKNYGSICSGGRYDNLAENYTDNILPGVGISIGITRLFFVLKEIGFIDNYNVRNKLDYLIIPIGDTIKYCTDIMKKLEKKGCGISIYFEDDTLKKKMNYADKIGVKNVILIGEDEVKSNTVKIKNMDSGNNVIINYIEL